MEKTSLLTLKSPRVKTFLISFIAAFGMVVLPKMGFHLEKSFVCKLPLVNRFCGLSMVTPIARPDPLDAIRPQLAANIKLFSLQKRTFLIPEVHAAGDYDGAKAYGVIDLNSGEVMMDKNLSQKLPIASLTKIMSAVVALDLIQPSDLFTVTQKATQVPPTRFALHPGEQFSLEELLNGALLTSANDCIEVIQDNIDTKLGEGVFVKAMNEKARLLGLKNTHFTNPQGFDDGTPFSSVEDLTILTRFALNHYPVILNIVQKDHEELAATNLHQGLYMNNWNGLISVYPGAYGVKIGNTDDAGYTTLVVSEREGHKLLAVVLGAPGIIERDTWAAQLLDEGFAQKGLAKAQITEADLRAHYATWKYFQ